jgi:hypothetical protein
LHPTEEYTVNHGVVPIEEQIKLYKLKVSENPDVLIFQLYKWFVYC